MSKQDAGTNSVNAIRELRALENLGSAEIAKLIRDLVKEAYGKHSDRGTPVSEIRRRDDVTRTPDAVEVNTKASVMQVFLDPDENYSVSGYNERASCSFGEIYLGLDKGPEYDRQSIKVNEALQRITTAEAFGLALPETRRVLAAHPDANDVDVTFMVLAGLCKPWFDQPDGANIFEGGMRDNQKDTSPPPRCAGDFIYPSGYIFSLEPGDDLTIAGQGIGRLLNQAIMRFVDELRMSDRLPNGSLSRVIFEAFPRGEDDLIARTIIGVMIGMLPTVILNLIFTLTAWRDDDGQEFERLQDELRRHRGSDPYVRAGDVLKKPMMQAMQKIPVPDAVWRTAVRDHTLDTEPPVKVNRGDKINVNIASATSKDLEKGITDVFPVFGGDRRATPHPTHACPAYEAAIGIMLGVIYGMMEPI